MYGVYDIIKWLNVRRELDEKQLFLGDECVEVVHAGRHVCVRRIGSRENDDGLCRAGETKQKKKKKPKIITDNKKRGREHNTTVCA